LSFFNHSKYNVVENYKNNVKKAYHRAMLQEAKYLKLIFNQMYKNYTN